MSTSETPAPQPQRGKLTVLLACLMVTSLVALLGTGIYVVKQRVDLSHLHHEVTQTRERVQSLKTETADGLDHWDRLASDNKTARSTYPVSSMFDFCEGDPLYQYSTTTDTGVAGWGQNEKEIELAKALCPDRWAIHELRDRLGDEIFVPDSLICAKDIKGEIIGATLKYSMPTDLPPGVSFDAIDIVVDVSLHDANNQTVGSWTLTLLNVKPDEEKKFTAVTSEEKNLNGTATGCDVQIANWWPASESRLENHELGTALSY